MQVAGVVYRGAQQSVALGWAAAATGVRQVAARRGVGQWSAAFSGRSRGATRHIADTINRVPAAASQSKKPLLAATAALAGIAAAQPRSTTWLLSDEDMSLDMIINEQQTFEEQLRLAHGPPKPQPLLVGWFRWLSRNLLLWGGVLLTGSSIFNLVRGTASKLGHSKLYVGISIATGVLCTALGLTWTIVHQLRRMLYLDNHEKNMNRYEDRLHWRGRDSLPYCIQESCEFALQFLNNHRAAQEHGFTFEMMPNVNVSIETEEERVHVRVFVAAMRSDGPVSLHAECIEAVNYSKTMDISAQSISDLIFPDVGKESFLHLVFSRESNDVVRVHLKRATGEFACARDFTDGVSFIAVEEGRIVNSVKFFREGKASRPVSTTSERLPSVLRQVDALLMRDAQLDYQA